MWAVAMETMEKIADLTPAVGTAPVMQQPTTTPPMAGDMSGSPPTSMYRSQRALGGNFMQRFNRTGVATPTKPPTPAVG
jgi:hypothetical protein